MVQSRINKRIVVFLIVITIWSNVIIYFGEIHNGILPKFISASYKDNLKLEFNSIFLKQVFNIMSKFFKINPPTISFLIGDLPIYPNAKNSKIYEYNSLQEEEQEFISVLKNNKNYTAKIPISNNTKYFLFPNHNKSKMNVILFSLEKVKDVNQNNLIFSKLSQISLYEIPINNFIINYQSEFNLKKAFFKLKWKIKLSGIITKYAFSNDYEQLCVVYKNITNNKEIKYNIVYINVNNENIQHKFYNTIELEGNLKIESLAVLNNIIVFSRKYDIYKLNFLIKDDNSDNWINVSGMKINPLIEPYNKIGNLKFISKNTNITNNTNRSDYNDNEVYLFMKGINCNTKGVYLYMKLLNIDLNKLNYQSFEIKNGTYYKKDNVIYIKNEHDNEDRKIIKESVSVYNQPLSPTLFEKKNYDLYEANYTFNLDNLELDKLNLYLRNMHTYTIFNKYLQKKGEASSLEFRFLSNFNTYNTLVMNSSFFYDIKANNYNEDDILIKTDESEITKICGIDGNYIFEFNNDRLSFITRINPVKINKEGDIEFFDTRRISFVSIPKCFKPKKIHDYYFDIFDNKYILILLIDDGVLLSLDFSKSIKNKNNSAVFLMDNISNKKIIMITINFFFLFFYSLDWTHFDQISRNIRNSVINFINNTDDPIVNENETIFNNNRFDNNILNLSSSSLSLLSNTSNDLNEDNNSNHNQNLNTRRLRRELNNDQRSMFEDLLGSLPY